MIYVSCWIRRSHFRYISLLTPQEKSPRVVEYALTELSERAYISTLSNFSISCIVIFKFVLRLKYIGFVEVHSVIVYYS